MTFVHSKPGLGRHGNNAIRVILSVVAKKTITICTPPHPHDQNNYHTGIKQLHPFANVRSTPIDMVSGDTTPQIGCRKLKD